MATLRVKGESGMVSKIIEKLNSKQAQKKEASYELVRAGDDGAQSKVKYVLTTGIDSFDHATGGLPFGRIIEIYGLEGSGKTAFAWRSATRAYQRMIFEKIQDPETRKVSWKQVTDCEVLILYIDNEQSLDDTSDQKLVIDGIEIKDGAVGRCDTVSDMFELIDDWITAVEAFAAKDPDRPYFIPIIVDTLAATSSDQELEAKWDDQDYVRQPAQIRRGFRRLTRRIMRSNTLLICNNQVSEKFAKMKRKGFGGPQPEDFETFGGRALKYYASLRVFMHVVSAAYKLNKLSVGGPSGFMSKFVVVKNRQVKPRRSGKFVLLYDRGLSNTFSTLETLCQLKLVAQSENGIYSFRFDAVGIEPTTFDDGRRGNPKLGSRAEWPAFYEAHKADLDKLWAKGKELMFADEALAATDDELLDSGKDEETSRIDEDA